MASKEDIEEWFKTAKGKGILRLKPKNADHTATGPLVKRPHDAHQISEKPPIGSTIRGRRAESLGRDERQDSPELAGESIKMEESQGNNKECKTKADDIQTSVNMDADDVTYDDVLLETDKADHLTVGRATQTSVYENLEDVLENVLQETLSDVETQTPPIATLTGGYENVSFCCVPEEDHNFTEKEGCDLAPVERLNDPSYASVDCTENSVGVLENAHIGTPIGCKLKDSYSDYVDKTQIIELKNCERVCFTGHDADGYALLEDDPNDHVYEEIGEPGGHRDQDSSFEPPWAGSVGQKGDVFYVESGTADWSSSEPPPGGTDQNQYEQLTSPNHPPMNNGLNNSPHHRQLPPHPQQEQYSDRTPIKTKKGLKKKVKGIITPKSKQNNNDLQLQNGSSGGSHHINNPHNPSQHPGSNNNNTAHNNYRNHLHNHNNHHTPPHTVTFNDVPTGLTKDVRLFVDPYKHNYGRRATLCETLFGVVPGYFGSKASQVNGTSRDRRIMVQGLLPGGEALRTGQVKIGDWLMCINDLEVNFDNFDSILSAITSPKEVKLTLQKLAVQPVTSPRPAVVRKSPVVNEALVRLVSGDRAQLTAPSLTDTPHAIMFLTLTSSEDGAPKDDVLYQYPEEESKLVEIRGLFLTLCHMLNDVTDNVARSSSMLIDNKLVHIAYAREGQQVLVIAFPADRLMLVQVNQIMEDVVRLLRVLYGSLKSAFSSPENVGRLNHFFSLLCERALLRRERLKEGLQTAVQHEPLTDLLPGVRGLALPEEIKVIVNNALSDFEAADFADMSEDFYDLRRAYTVMGCSLFYKGYLLASHLHREDLVDASLYLRYYCLLTLCHFEQMGQVVVWKEVFPWRRCHVQTDPLLPGYTEPEARWFLLVVGMKNIMLAVLLEAGGCAAWAEGHPTPDPFYVDQAKASLLQLEALDIPNQCETRLLSPSVPSLASVDWFFPNLKGVKDESAVLTPLVKVQNSPKTGVSPSKKLLQPESILKKRPGGSTPSPQTSLRPPPARPGALYDVESDADSHSTGNSDASTPIMDRRGRKPSAGSDESGGSAGSSSLFKGQKKKRTLLSAYDVSGLKSSLREINAEEGSFVKLTTGCDNTLFHYVQLDVAEGVILCPTQQELAAVTTPTHTQLLANFHQACLAIRKVFQDTSKKQHLQSTGSSGQFGAGAALGSVREHGILFSCTPENWVDSKKAPPAVSYWVVGRQLPEPYKREFYVCFQDSAQQNLIELAFKLGFGVLV